MDETTLLLTLVLFAPLGLITLLQVVEAGPLSSLRRESRGRSRMPAACATNLPS
jgi:hypothetical protein